MSETRKPILCLDFDGVIHAYRRGWQDGLIYDDVTDGFFEWMLDARHKFRLVVYSSRSREPMGTERMKSWLYYQAGAFITASSHIGIDIDEMRQIIDNIEFAHEKPPAFITIDDRAVQFRGDWSVSWLDPAALLKFKPWNME